jgi:hypothetical protein
MSLKRFDSLVGELKRTLAGLTDKRTGENTRYSTVPGTSPRKPKT